MKRSFRFSPSHIVLMVLCFLFLGVGYLSAQTTQLSITGFFPKSARQGDTISIIGSKFTGTTKVEFGINQSPGLTDLPVVPAASFTVVSDTLIKAVLGDGECIQVMVTRGFRTTRSGFQFIRGPFLFEFSNLSSIPTNTAKMGDTLIFICDGANEVTDIAFGGVPAASFALIAPNKIRAIVGTGATGVVSVTKPIGTSTCKGFVYEPTFTSFSPSSGKQGDTITINGIGFTPLTLPAANIFLLTNATFTPVTSFLVLSPTQIKAVVGTGQTGFVRYSMNFNNVAIFSIGVPGGLFTFLQAPTITNFSPTCANTGDTVSISGTSLNGVNQVLFGGVPATAIIPVSSTLVKAVVGAGASGNVQIVTLGGTATKAGFTFGSRPIVSTILPTSAKTGDTVKILGSGLNAVSTITFGGVSATAIIPVSATFVKAVVGAGASGIVAVTTPCGTAGKSGFLFISPPPLPIITIFQQAVHHGDTLSIRGLHLSNTISVVLAGLPQQQIINVSDSLIKVVVVSAADRRLKIGVVSITTTSGTTTTPFSNFCNCLIHVCPSFPITTSVSPTTFHKGDTLSISGTGLLSVSKIFIQAQSNFTAVPNLPPSLVLLEVPMDSFTIISDNLIKAVVGNGVSGQLFVLGDCGGGGPARPGFPNGGPIEPLMTCLTPTIHGFFPQSARKGDTVFIRGDFVGGPTSVSFGGVPAEQFSFTPDIPGNNPPLFYGTIRAIVGAVESGDIQVTTDKGSDTMGGFTFLSTFTAKAPKNSDEQSLLKKSATPSEESLTVYPNPVTNTVTIETILKSNENAAEVILSDVLGNRLWSSRETPQGGKLSKQIDLSHYTPGIYRVEVIGTTGERRTARVMKR